MMTEYNCPEMADDPHSSSSSDSDSNESSIASMSEFLKPETFPLCSMDSSSDSEGCQPVSSNFHIQIKPKTQERNGISRFERWKTSNLDAYLGDIISNQGKVKFFPENMDKFLSTQYKGKYLELSSLQHGTFFIYLARSLIVTLNVDNPRVRVPKSLVFDACIFSEDNPVVVLSVFDTDKNSTRMDMYNNFLARGVIDALRSRYREDITIINSAVTMDHNFMEEVPRLWENPGVFHIPSSLDMWRDKAENVALALLKAVSVASSFPLLYPDKVDSDDVWFLTPPEFQFLTNFIDLQGDNEGASVEGDALLLQTEICLRLRKRYKAALLMTSEKLHTNIGDSYTSSDEFQKVEAANYELLITDVPIDRKQSEEETRKEPMAKIFIDVLKTEERCKPKQKIRSFDELLENFKKLNTNQEDEHSTEEPNLYTRNMDRRVGFGDDDSGYSSGCSSTGSNTNSPPRIGNSFGPRLQSKEFDSRDSCSLKPKPLRDFIDESHSPRSQFYLRNRKITWRTSDGPRRRVDISSIAEGVYTESSSGFDSVSDSVSPGRSRGKGRAASQKFLDLLNFFDVRDSSTAESDQQDFLKGSQSHGLKGRDDGFRIHQFKPSSRVSSGRPKIQEVLDPSHSPSGSYPPKTASNVGYRLPWR